MKPSRLVSTTITSLLLSFSAGAETYQDLRSKAFSDQEEMAVRWNSFMQMVKTRKAESIPDVKKALKSNQWFMRNAGLIALDSISPELAYEEAKKQLEDPALVVRSAAVDILAKHKNQKKVSEVRELLWKELHAKRNKVKSQSLWIRPQIGQYLAQNPLPSEKEKFLGLAEEKDSEVKAYAEKALEKLQSE